MRFLLLLMWSTSGMSIAWWFSPRGPGRLAWAPPAAILGPLWACVAAEQRTEHRDRH